MKTPKSKTQKMVLLQLSLIQHMECILDNWNETFRY